MRCADSRHIRINRLAYLDREIPEHHTRLNRMSANIDPLIESGQRERRYRYTCRVVETEAGDEEALVNPQGIGGEE